MHFMNPVENTQNITAVYRARNQRYVMDTCLPQRRAVEKGKVGFHALSHGHYPGVKVPSQWLSGVSSLGYFDVIGHQDWGIPPHRNEGIEICFQETGEAVMTVDATVHSITANTLTITRPWQLHSMGDPSLKPGRLHWLIIDVGVRHPNQDWILPDWCVLTDADQETLIRMLRGNEHPTWPASGEVSSIFSELSKLVRAKDPESAISRIRIQLNRLLVALLDLMCAQQVIADRELTSGGRVVELFLKQLQEDVELLALPWTLDSMGKHCGMGRTVFSAHCRERINMTPMAALNRWRLRHAARILRDDPDQSITRIAMDVGFSSSQYFARKFQQRYRQSPRQWRQQVCK